MSQFKGGLAQIKFWAVIVYRMLRLRTVFLMWTFEAIGYEAVKPTKSISVKFLLVAVMLSALYVCATCFNDAADEEIDKVNLPHDLSRPLVTTKVSGYQLQIMGVIALIIAALAALLVSPFYLFFIPVGAGLNIFYSVSPIKMSYRGIFASLWLSLSYVVLPFLGGGFISGAKISGGAALLLLSIYSFFVGRILLKDFRDYEGDKKFGKLNYLVRHGPQKTCRASAVAWLIGDLILSVEFFQRFPVLVGLVQPLSAVVMYELYLLANESVYKNKLREVAIIGRMGNAVVVALLTQITLQAFSYSTIQNDLLTLIIGLFVAMSAFNVQQPINQSKKATQ